MSQAMFDIDRTRNYPRSRSRHVHGYSSGLIDQFLQPYPRFRFSVAYPVSPVGFGVMNAWYTGMYFPMFPENLKIAIAEERHHEIYGQVKYGA